MKDKPDSKGLNNFPMSVGQLTGSGKNLEYNFASQPRPVNNLNVDSLGRQLLKDSHENQIKEKFPKQWESAVEGQAKADAERQKAQADADRIKAQLQDKGLPAELKKHLNQELKKVNAERAKYIEEAKKEGAKQKQIADKTKHSNNEKCPECKLMAQKADEGKKGDLKGAWQVAYGERPGVNNGQWGVQEPCSGRGDEYDCKRVQKDNGVENLYKTAKELLDGKTTPDANLCKRGKGYVIPLSRI